MFGGFALQANSFSHLEQIDSYTPGHQVRFGNLNYTADIRRDLIFNGFGPTPGALNGHNEHGLDPLSDNIQDIAPAIAPDLNPGQIALSEDGWMDPAPEAAYSSAVEPNTDSTPQGSLCHRTPGFVSGCRFETARPRVRRIWLCSGNGVHRGWISFSTRPSATC